MEYSGEGHAKIRAESGGPVGLASEFLNKGRREDHKIQICNLGREWDSNISMLLKNQGREPVTTDVVVQWLLPAMNDYKYHQ